MFTFSFFLVFLLVYTVLAVYAERKISAFIQDRTGPMEVGYYGILQTVADLLKLIQKEDIVPATADKVMFKAAPFVIFAAIFGGFAILPLAPGLSGSAADVGVFFLLAIVSLDVIGVLMAGWGSNSKFSLFGSMRAVAQIISYEIPLAIAVLTVVAFSQTLNLQEMSYQQGLFSSDSADSASYLFGLSVLGIEVSEYGGFLSWNIIRMPLLIPVFIIFFIASLAEANRAPFDLPESESELVGGFHTEYSGFRWSMIMLSEYAMMLLVSLLAAVLFFGSWNTPFLNIGNLKLADWTSGALGEWTSYVWGAFWLLSKALMLVALQMWVRWTYPRLRVDQLMSLCWKYLTPAAIILFLAVCYWKILL